MNSNNENEINSKYSGIYAFLEAFKDVLSSIAGWCQENNDLLLGIGAVFEFSKATDICAKYQIVLSDDLPPDVVSDICKAENPSAIVENYYTENNGNHLNELFEKCIESDYLNEYHKILFECYTAYQQGMNLLCCAGLFALADGLISEISENTGVGFSYRLRLIKETIEKSDSNCFDIDWIYSFEGLNKTLDSIWGHVSFDEDPKDEINRNRVLHGRTKREYTAFDVTKVLLIVYALNNLKDLKINMLSELN